MMVWIKRENEGSYVSLMKNNGSTPQILEYDHDYVRVLFDNASMTTWVNAGMWYSYEID